MKVKLKNKVKDVLEGLKLIAKRLKREVGALYLACRRKDIPLYVKVAAVIVVGYALSPIDLIPDFVPILGYLDDLILLPLGIKLVLVLMPPDIMEECRRQSEDIFKDYRPKNWKAGIVIISIWVLLLTLGIKYVIKYWV